MIAALTNHLWQSTLFVLAAGVVAFSLRNNAAHIRHCIWLAASLKFLLPFSLLMSLGTALAPARSAPPPGATDEAASLSVAVDRLAQPFADEIFSPGTSVSPERQAPTTNWTPIILATTWLCGFAAVVLVRLRGWQRVRTAVRESVPARIGIGAANADLKVRATKDLLEPGVVGIWRPVLLLPADIEQQLTRAQLDAVLAHEMCHVQRRDNLTSVLHMIVEAIFWYHPLVWVVGAKLVDERERACDEHVLQVCGEPQAYAESILNVCKRYVESPVACVSGVSGADLKRRVSAIVNNRIGVQLNAARRVALSAAVAAAILLPIVAGALVAPLRVAAFTGEAIEPSSQQAPTFEVATLKPCDPNSPPTVGGAPGMRGYAPWVPQTSPGHIVWTCATLAQLIDQAYVDRDHPLLNISTHPRAAGISGATDSLQGKRVRGGPSWVDTEKFAIEAKIPVDAKGAAVGSSPQILATLPASIAQSLRAMLEDRFQLKVHRATEQQDMYALSIAKGGLNKDRMKPAKPGDCMTREEYAATDPAMRGNLRICGNYFVTMTSWDFRGGTLPQLAQALSSMMDRYVIDKTGEAGTFTYILDFAPFSDVRGDDRFIAAAGALGLKIDRTKASAEYIQIDSVQKPRPDFRISAAPRSQIAFDVVSIKPCPDVSMAQTGRGAGPNLAQTSPGHVYWACVTLASLVDQAYAGDDFPLRNRQDQPLAIEPKRGEARDDRNRIRGGPSWMYSDRFTIEATASVDVIGPARGNLMRLPPAMNAALRAMLVERFQLQTRRATEDLPMYALSVAKTGVKARPRAAGDCEPPPSVRPLGTEGRPTVDGFFQGTWFCGTFSTAPLRMQARLSAGEDLETVRSTSDLNRRFEYRGVTMQTVADQLAHAMDRWVLDKTSLAGEFLMAVEFRSDDATPRGGWFVTTSRIDYGGVRRPQTPTGEGATIFKAFEALGLKLEPASGLAEYLLIESVQKPKPNSPGQIIQ